jgi:uncharacterized protein YcfJ
MNKLITATILAALLVTPVAYANDLDKVLGAATGAAIGSTIGKGKGRTIAMAAGALIGANLADSNRDRYYNDNEYYYGSNGIVYSRSYSDVETYFYRQCKREVPARYNRNSGTRNAWISGCVNRKVVEQQEIENEAYHEGSEGGHRYHRE